MNDERQQAREALDETLRRLQESRVQLLRKLSVGSDRQAAEIGRKAIAEAQKKFLAGKQHIDRLAGPSRELASIIEKDVEVADAIHSGDVSSALVAIVDTYELAGSSADSLIVAKTFVKTRLSATLASPLRRYLSAPAAVSKVDHAAAIAPATRLISAYVHQGPLALRACRHGNPTISGRCHRPPCPAAS